jgi:hypothetical protein
MAKSTQWIKVSGWLFLLGILLSIVGGLNIVAMDFSTWLVVIGFIVGLIAAFGLGAYGKDQTEMFLLATIALIAAGSSGAALTGVPYIGTYLVSIVGNIAALVAPIAVIIAVKALWDIAAVKLK